MCLSTVHFACWFHTLTCWFLTLVSWGTPPPSPRPQSLCECFRSPTVLAACGPEPANQTQCLGSIRDHYVTHVHHKYCVTHTEAACQFECQWPLPGFFGDLIAKGVTA